MSNEEPKWADGLKIFDPHEKAPDYILASIVIDVEEFITTLKRNNAMGEVRLTVKRSQNGTPYAVIDEWRPAPREYQGCGETINDPPGPQERPQRAPLPPPAPSPPPFPNDKADFGFDATPATNGLEQGRGSGDQPELTDQPPNDNSFDVGEESIDDIPF